MIYQKFISDFSEQNFWNTINCIFAAMAVLDIIRRSVDAEPTVESIFWTSEDRCDAKTCRNDDLADFFWPKLMKVRKQVKEAKEEELDYLKAKLCANSEEVGCRI